MVFYEAPHRILECVADMAEVIGGEREILIAREMTKLHEQIVRMPLPTPETAVVVSAPAPVAAMRPRRAAPKAPPKSPATGSCTGQSSAVAIAFSQ